MTSATTVGDSAPLRPAGGFLGRTLADGLAGRRNSFGVIRLGLASAVIFSHAFYLGDWGHDPFVDLVKGQDSIGGIAVLGFFAISGYLIAKSAATNDALQFIWRRALRIFPAFWAVLLVTALVVGPVFWVLEGNQISTYFTFAQGGPFWYVVGNADLTIRQYGIYDIFATTTPYGESAGPVFNGSLWTLYYEWGCYLLLWGLVIFGVMARARFLVPALTVFMFIAQIAAKIVPGSGRDVFPFLGDGYRLSLTLIFLWGASLALYARRIPMDARLAALATIVMLVSLRYGGWAVLGYPALAYIVLWLAAALPRSFQWIGSTNDYSYGVYVYGFLVQQVTAYFGWNRWGYVPWVTASLVLTFGCAWLSWHGVEKHAMALKDVGPGRGLQYWWARAKSRIPRRSVARPE